jgi:O-antigen ligase
MSCTSAIRAIRKPPSPYLKLRSIPRRIALLSLSITAAALPLYIVRWHYGPLPTTLLETLIGITVIAYLVTLWSERRLPHAPNAWDIPIALLLIAGVISIFDAPNRLAAAGIYRAYFVEAIACYYIAIDLLRDRKDVTTFLLFAGTSSGVYAVGQIVSVLAAIAGHRLDLSAGPSFLNTSANADAMYLEPPLAFALAFALFPSRPRERWLAGGLLAVLFVGLLFAFSRASYLAMAILAGVIVLSAQSRRWRLRAIAVLAVLALVSLEIPIINRRFLTLADSVSNRESLYRQALQMLSHMPITGAGIAGYSTRVAPYRPPGAIIHIYPHDLWLTTWSEIGLVGVIAFAVIFFGALVRGARALGTAGDISRPLLWGSVGTLILWGVHGLFDTPYWKNDLSAEFWFALALQVVAIRLATAPPARPSPSPSPPKPT